MGEPLHLQSKQLSPPEHTMCSQSKNDVESNEHTSQGIKFAEYENPQRWKAGKKCKFFVTLFWGKVETVNLGMCTTIVVSMTATVAFCSSIYTAAIEVIADHYGCSRLVSTLGVTTFLLGIATGPLLFAPLSEVWSAVLVSPSNSMLHCPAKSDIGVASPFSELHCYSSSSPRLAAHLRLTSQRCSPSDFLPASLAPLPSPIQEALSLTFGLNGTGLYHWHCSPRPAFLDPSSRRPLAVSYQSIPSGNGTSG